MFAHIVGIFVGIQDLTVGISVRCPADSELRSLEAGSRHKTVSVGNSHYISVYPKQKGGASTSLGGCGTHLAEEASKSTFGSVLTAEPSTSGP